MITVYKFIIPTQTCQTDLCDRVIRNISNTWSDKYYTVNQYMIEYKTRVLNGHELQLHDTIRVKINKTETYNHFYSTTKL